MNVANYLKMSILTLTRDAMFYGYHMAESQNGKTCIKDNAVNFCETFYPDSDYDIIVRSYYKFINNYKANEKATK